ncbi:hypothetical protein PUMCH_005117 [Australozyma saopauloensis]|uniref:Uncharacterized protein n=1 Tax=Australozyma saopauloensis TaxID=291208 RepID=A0AAX4HI76_9ASCO|nr:hypothetical protein PUMCH_005117 [[Candida] saopauloensis]
MKFTLATLATAAIVSASPIRVSVLNSNGKNIGFLNTKFGASSGQGFVDSTASTYELSDTNVLSVTSENGNQYALQYLGVADAPVYLMSFSNRNSNPVPLEIGGDAKIVNYNWWACKYTWSPDGISDELNQIVGVNATSWAKPFPNCRKVDLVLSKVPAVAKREINSSGAASSVPTTLSTQPSPTSNAVVNTWTTDGRVIGQQAVWCQKSSVVTFTSCSSNDCAIVKTTGSAGQMVSCTACLLPKPSNIINFSFPGFMSDDETTTTTRTGVASATRAASATATATATTSATSTSSASSTSTSVSRGEAGRNMAGAFGAFAMAALLLV